MNDTSVDIMYGRGMILLIITKQGLGTFVVCTYYTKVKMKHFIGNEKLDSLIIMWLLKYVVVCILNDYSGGKRCYLISLQ